MKHARPDYTERIQDSAGLIPDDEPVLLIRGQDRAAVPCMIAWIAAYLEAGGADLNMLVGAGSRLPGPAVVTAHNTAYVT